MILIRGNIRANLEEDFSRHQLCAASPSPPPSQPGHHRQHNDYGDGDDGDNGDNGDNGDDSGGGAVDDEV